MENYKLGIRASWITIIINIILAVSKIVAGILGSSNAMVADGVHTLSDILTTFVVLMGLKISSKEADDEHPYGHEKYESVFAKILSVLLLLTGIFIGYKSITILINGDIKIPKSIALITAFLSIIVKEGMYWYTIKIARKIKSISMEADAWHHRSDAFSSVGTFVGVLGARLGFPALDPIAGIIVSMLVIKVGGDLYIKSVKELVDESASKEMLKIIKEKTKSIDGVRGIKDLKTRVFGNKIYVDIEIFVDSNISVKIGHDIAEKVHDRLEAEISDIKHCMIHIEPFQK
ncbi:cation diffusion facilitator family transporter [Tissierella praeacuta]|uniref:Cation diffusion facilitator family transporter n=1 Tax=Tissierella praeacuta DSM 18095 TaxID=1123404 RepID=A0A1M4ZQY1_9FIRM|nr:cation diffusion facilitator family transporter [Tissierella praeacuta]HAE91518.1 cation transporter [Tissierella sp.]MBU5254588.1 cation diffusion facilitator family transporter [Tissierella praeacuta]TCU64711.1 cation diffusion facilitator family transporter [Tissierella praeacuta]SHF20500.1 cation diffusion facilitator family transporter [Tissierella praeacuta DSM 18095]SUP01874.1 Ferrous-iron efflux pump FieF [Tissierella praeacuta]